MYTLHEVGLGLGRYWEVRGDKVDFECHDEREAKLLLAMLNLLARPHNHFIVKLR